MKFIIPQFDALNLNGKETVRPWVKVDNTIAAVLAHLKVSDLSSEDELTVHSYNSNDIDSLQPVFWIKSQNVYVSTFSKELYPKEQIVEVRAKARSGELSQRDIGWFQKENAIWQIFIQRSRNGQPHGLLYLNVDDPLFISDHLLELEIDDSASPSQIDVGRAQLMAPPDSDDAYITVSEFYVRQPEGVFPYVGPSPKLSVKCSVSLDDNIELSNQLMENKNAILAELESVSNPSQRAKGENPSLYLEPGEECIVRAKLRVDRIREMLPEDALPIIVSFEIVRGYYDSKHEFPPSSAQKPMSSEMEIETQTRIIKSRGEFIRVTLSGEQLFPHFAKQIDGPNSEFSGRSVFRSKISSAAFKDKNPTNFGLSFELLEKNFVNIEARVTVNRNGARVHTGSTKNLDFLLLFGEQVEFSIDDTKWLAEVSEAIRDKDGCELCFDLLGTINNTKYNANLVIPIADVVKEPALTFCLDFGASATAVWVGKTGGSSAQGFDLPMGAFAKEYYGEHAESLDGSQNLLPMTLELNPDSNVRRRFDPHSFGNMERAWSTEEAILSRLLHNDRNYDVTIDVTGSLHLKGGRSSESTSLNNLKSQIVSDDGTGLAAAMRPFKRRNSNNELENTKYPILADLLCDTFDELADYFVPNSLYMLKNSNLPDEARLLYDTWLQTSQSEMQIIQTYPSGLGSNQLASFKAAGRKFAHRLLSDGSQTSNIADPKFIPEGLAATFDAISKRAGKLEAGAFFACIDIGASTVDAALVKVNKITSDGALDVKDPWQVLAHFGQPVGGDDLDKTIVELAFKFLIEELSPKDGKQSQFKFKLPYDLEFSSEDNESPTNVSRRARVESLIRQELFKVVRAAKVRDSSETFEASKGRSYSWNNLPAQSNFRLDMTEILELELPIVSSRRTSNETKTASMFLAESGKSTEKVIELNISRLLLKEANTDLKRPAAPGDVAQLLGEAIPTLLIRAAAQYAGSMPINLNWVISGRGSLWPPIYEGIHKTLSLSKNAISHNFDFLPAPAEELKQRVINGARALARSGVSIDSTLPNPLAIIQQVAKEEMVYGGRYVYELVSIDYLSDPSSQYFFTEKSYQYLVIALPGLDDTIEPNLMKTSEIQVLFARMYKGLRLYRDLAQLINKYDATPEGKLEWQYSPDDRLLSWNIGDGWNTSDAGGP